MHLVGDIHQPLHAISMYSEDFPDGDRGGNSIVVRENDIVMRLHAYWDGALGNSDAYEAIEFLADNIVNDPQLQRGKLRELAERPAFASWAEESYRYAAALAYLNGRLRGASIEAHSSKATHRCGRPADAAFVLRKLREVSRRRDCAGGVSAGGADHDAPEAVIPQALSS